MRGSPLMCWVLASFVVAVGLAVGARDQPGAPAKPPADAKPVSVASFWEQLPMGHLGVPLGTVVRVTGVAVDGNTTQMKVYAGKTLLRVTAVNGKELAEPVVFEFGRTSEPMKVPAPGAKFDYYAHEYGDFDGMVTAPKEFGIDTLPKVASTRFGYHRRLHIHAATAARK